MAASAADRHLRKGVGRTNVRYAPIGNRGSREETLRPKLEECDTGLSDAYEHTFATVELYLAVASLGVVFISDDTRHRPNEKKISDGYRERASIEVEVF